MRTVELAHRMRTRAGAAAIGLGALALVSGCQVGLGSDDTEKAARNANTERAASAGNNVATLTPEPLAPHGTARIDGSTRGSLTATAATRYNDSGGSAEVSVANHGAQTAFAALCRGGIDMVDSARAISAAELDTCRQHGLQVVQLQFASDAVVLATKSETDVGGDCLTLSQVDNIYRAGSPVTNWRDIGFDNVPIRVGGPDRKNNAFDFFGRSVLDAPEPSMTYLRSDYLAFSDDAATRRFITATADDRDTAKLASHYAQLVASQKGVVASAKANYADAKATQAAALANRRKGIVDGRTPSVQAQDRTRLLAAAAVTRDMRRILTRAQDKLDALQAPAKASDAAQKAVAALRGRLAYFRFTYYELFEDDLRPFEISADGTKRDCVFPSEATITSGSYPLSRRLLLTTTTRSLGRSEVQDFLLRYLGSASKDAIDARLLPIPDSVLAQQRAWVQGSEQPRVLTPADLTGTATEAAPAR